MDKKPKVKDLHRLFDSSADQYMLIGTALGVEVKDLLPHPQSTTSNLILVFERWMDLSDGVTWRNALKVCKDYPKKFGEVKSNIEKFLSSEEARESYCL